MIISWYCTLGHFLCSRKFCRIYKNLIIANISVGNQLLMSFCIVYWNSLPVVFISSLNKYRYTAYLRLTGYKGKLALALLRDLITYWVSWPDNPWWFMFLCFQFKTDLGSGGESVKKIETKTFVGSAALNTAKTELTTVRLLLDEICHYFFSLLYKEFWSIDFLFWIWPCHLL